MSNLKRIFFGLPLLLVFSFSAFSAVVSKVEFSGLKRTNPSYAESFFSDFIGRDTETFEESEIEDILVLSGLFSSYEIEIEENDENEAVIKISVTEKISFMPLPFVMYSNDGFRGGFFLMDMNAFGRQDNFILGAFASFSSISGMGVFSTRERGSLPGFTVNFSIGKGNEKNSTIDDDEISDFDKFWVQAGVRAGKSFGKFTKLTIGTKYEFNDIDGDDKFSNFYLITRANFSTKPKWNGFFTLQNALDLSADLVFSTFDDFTFSQQYAGSASYNQQIVSSKIVFHGNLSCAYIKNPIPGSFLGKGNARLSILPSNFRTDFIGSAVAGFEFATFKTKSGLFSLYANYETGIANVIYDDEIEFFHGPAAGMIMYLSKVAVPAMAFGFSYNVTYNKFYFAFSLGVGM